MNTKKYRFVIDLDGTLCEQRDSKTYHIAPPRTDIIEKVNKLWREGHNITIFTARGMNTYSGDVKKVEEVYRVVTEEWLERNNVYYDKLLFGKPPADMYIDDKNISIDEFLRGENIG